MNKLIWIIFLLFISISSYLREILFLSINQYLIGNKNFYASTFEIFFLEDLNTTELNHLKIVLTILFTFLIAGLTILGLRNGFKKKIPMYISIGTYGFILLLTFLYLLILLISQKNNEIYSSLRFVIEYLHTPFIYLFLSVSFYGNLILNESKS